jgi:hypothetical protein
MRSNGSDGVVLRDLAAHDSFALWPAWHGNDEISFTAADESKSTKVGDEQRLPYDLVLYKVTEKGELQPIKTLSEGWDVAMKPYLRVNEPSSNPVTTKP